MRQIILALAAIALAAAPASAQTQVGHAFKLSILKCKYVQCRTAEGMQPGLTTLEATGSLLSVAGYDVNLVFLKRQGGKWHAFDARKVGVMSDGSFTLSVPAYNFADGTYAFVLTPLNDGAKILAGGAFVKSGGTAHEEAQSPSDARPAHDAPSRGSSTLAGEWIGIAGTVGALHIHADGTYAFNDQPGTYEVSGKSVVFHGPLSVWNDGRATIGNRVIEFYWTTAQGAKQYFVFEKT